MEIFPIMWKLKRRLSGVSFMKDEEISILGEICISTDRKMHRKMYERKQEIHR